jgi:hypothetical protein
MTPAYARSPQVARAEVSEPFNQGGNISTIGSLSLSGVGPTMSIEGAAECVNRFEIGARTLRVLAQAPHMRGRSAEWMAALRASARAA